MSRKFWIVFSVMLSALMAPTIASATCTVTGVIVRVTSYDDAYTATGGYIYFRTSSLSPYYYYVTSNDDDTISNAISYLHSGRTLTINGSVAACPAVPVAGGAAFIGTLNYMYGP